MKTYYEWCVVECFDSSRQDLEPSSCCGVLLENGYILTHATLLTPFVNDTHHAFLRESGKVNSQTSLKLSYSVILGDTNKKSSEIPKVSSLYNQTACHQDDNVNSTLIDSRDIGYKAKLVHLWKCENLEQKLEKFMPSTGGWNYNEEASEKSEISDYVNNLLPYFILLKLEAGEIIAHCSSKILPSNCIVTGDEVTVIGTPFGNLNPQVFMGSISKGVISRKLDEEGTLMMTDARCILGQQGSGVYIEQKDGKRYLVGIVIAPLCWRNGEWIGLSLVSGLSAIISSLKKTKLRIPSDLVDINDIDGDNKGQQKMRYITESVVAVQCGSNSGSGVLIDPYTVLTCSHVVTGRNFVKVTTSNGRTITGHVVYAVPDGDPFDLGILKLTSKCNIPPVEMINTKNILKPGKKLRVVGYPLFTHDHTLLTPSITQGILSKVVSYQNIPILIQTDVNVNPGASGGAVIDEQGCLVGLVSGNTRDSESKASFPNISLAIPITPIMSILKQFLKTRDPSVLEDLRLDNNYIRDLWNLKHPDTPKSRL